MKEREQMTLFPDIKKKVEEGFPAKYDSMESLKVVNKLDKHLSIVNYDFDEWLDLCLAAVEGREEEFMKIEESVKKDPQKYKNYMAAFKLLAEFFFEGYYDDILGQFHMRNFRSVAGYFPTPFHISKAMAEMTNVSPDKTVMDPCCGSGGMLLACKYVIHQKYGWVRSCHYIKMLYGIDINPRVVKMCKLQLYLTNYLYMIDKYASALIEMKRKIER